METDLPQEIRNTISQLVSLMNSAHKEGIEVNFRIESKDGLFENTELNIIKKL
jgi:hypothetical protein